MYFRNIFACVIATVCVALMMSRAQAQSIPCGGEYTVRPGDTLSSIAYRAYGNAAAIEVLFNSNRRRIGNDPSLITKGTVLFIPCREPGPGGDQTGVTIPAAIRQPADIALLTGSDYAPFTDLRYTKGGMISAIVLEAFEKGAPDQKISIDWVNDWSAHLKTLLVERRAFDGGFPWYRPDCDRRETLDRNGRLRCDNFYFSEPLYDSIIPFFALRDAVTPVKEPEQLHGKRVCRPAEFLTFDLIEMGLLSVTSKVAENKIEFIQPGTPKDCFELLVSGEVDFVSINSLTAESTISRMGISDKVEAHDGVARIVSHHFVVPRNRPEGAALMRRFNIGLAALQKSGRLQELKQEYLLLFQSDK